MITHREAEILTSARQDAPLDPVVERELQAHLATCEDCRAFAVATERLTAGIKAIPAAPVNPRIRREVMETVNAGRNPLARLFAGVGGGFQTGPVLAAAATLVIIGLFGWMALDRLVLDGNGGDDNNQIAAVPTEQPIERFVASPTQVPATETPVPTEPVAPTATTAPVEPTATTAPVEPTATTAPVEPTATTAPVEPTATTAPVEPTATTAPVEPTATTAPESPDTNAAGTEEGPVDLTGASTESTEAPATEIPTEVQVEPTVPPTPVPTSTEVPTAEPTVPPTPEPTVPPATEEPPAIEPMDGSEVVDAVATSEVFDGTGSAGESDDSGNTEVTDGTSAADLGDVPATTESDEANVPIEPTGDEPVETEVATTPATGSGPEEGTTVPIEAAGEQPTGTEEATAEPDTGGVIEPVDGAPVEGEETPAVETETEITQDSTPSPEELETDEPESGNAVPMSQAAVPYTGIDGDPSGRLGLTPFGALQFMAVPDAASMTTSAGFQVQLADSQPGVVNVCGEGICEPGMAAPEAEGWQGDVPMGVIGETVYVMRMYGDRTEIYVATSSGTQLVEPQLLTEIGPTSPPSAVYENEGVLFAWLPGGQWIEIGGGSAQVYSGAYANPTGLRFAPVASQGPLLGYFSEGTLVIAPITAPDSPVFSIPSDGVDFDMTPLADRVAVIRGNDIVIYDISGAELIVYEGGDMQPGSLIWLNSGIVFVDRNTGALYQIPETAT